MKVRFASDEAYRIQQEIMKVFTHSAVEASIELAEEKGMFRDCEPEKHANHPYWRSINLPENLVERIRKSGIRNSSLFSIQPTGNTGVFANIVSGGLEPIFGQEWIRTVIVNSPPDELLDLVPKYWEGDFKPNKYFKVSKEGTDDILRYVHTDDTVYKIDRNRGLTKEVLCQDYSVRVLKELGEWNPKADWAITAFDLTVEEHVKDMEGFAKWIDSSISKTINVKNDYPFEDFKEIYLNAYKGQKLKGITTYREGTMANVLALKTEVKKVRNDAPKRDKTLNCDIYSVKVKGEKFFVIIGLLNGPYEVFAGRQDFELDKLHSSGKIEKVKRGQYRLLIDDEVICENVCDHLNDEEEIITRLVSTGLRHSVDLNFLVHQIEKSQGALNSLGKAIARCLKKYLEDGIEVTGEDCPECGGKLQRKEGCASCQCGFSKCG
jgi:ribonucleoside-diphosphate reductase alpha chain